MLSALLYGKKNVIREGNSGVEFGNSIIQATEYGLFAIKVYSHNGLAAVRCEIDEQAILALF